MKKQILLTIIFIAYIMFLPTVSLAEDGIGCSSGLGPIAEALCKAGKGDPSNTAAGTQLNKVISTIIGVMTAVAAIWFIFQFIIAGYQWIQSGGEKNNIEQARDKITNSLIGLIIVVSAWIIIGVIGKILGLNILNPGEILINLGKK